MGTDHLYRVIGGGEALLNLPFDSRENPFETPGCVGRDLLEVFPPRSERMHIVLQSGATPACEATSISIAAARLQLLPTLHSPCVIAAQVLRSRPCPKLA